MRIEWSSWFNHWTFFSKSLTPSQSHCSGSCSIRTWKARWDSGYAPIIIPDVCIRIVKSTTFSVFKFSRTVSTFVKGNLSKLILRACDSFGWVPVCLDSGVWRSGGKPIIKIRKFNPCLLRRRENAVQRTPPRAHLPWADYHHDAS